MANRFRVVVAVPNPVESASLADWLLADGFEPVIRPTPQAIAEELRTRTVALVIADALLFRSTLLQAQLRASAPLTPTMLIGDDGLTPQREDASSQIITLARPIDRAMFGCFVSMAIMDGRPARRSVRKPVNRFDAVANGVPSHIVDVSAEGLRLEVPRDRRAVLPPYFMLQVPLAGIAVTVQRMWTGSASNGATTVWYGGAVAQNQPRVAENWRRFVDTLPQAAQIASL
jgi:hypothetical protein